MLFEIDDYSRIDFVRRSVAEISGGTDELPPYLKWAGSIFSPSQLADEKVSGPSADPDEDGMNNSAEFGAGTNPLSANSVLKLDLLRQPNGSYLIFPAVSNKTYTVQSATNLNPGVWQRVIDIAASASNSSITVPVNLANQTVFYRVTTPKAP